MTIRIPLALACAALLLGACGTDSEPADPPADSGASVDRGPIGSPEATPTPDATAVSRVTVRVNDETLTIEPTDVYCSGTPGRIRHLVAKTGGRPPIVEADATNFVMVTQDRGRPWKAEEPSGVSYDESSVTFDSVRLSGGAVLDGSLTCSTWQD